METLSDEKIKSIIDQYKKKRDRENRKYNEDNPKKPICYELTWNKDEYKVRLLDLGVDKT